MPLELSPKTSNTSPVKGGLDLPRLFTPRVRISAKDRMFFTEQLALLLETGLNLHNALKTLQTQTHNRAMQKLIGELSEDINDGKPFSYSLSRHPEIFSSTYINLVAASESGGYVQEVLADLLAMEEKRQELKAILISTMSYPIFLMVFSIAVVIFILVFIFPKFGDLFTSIKSDLPTTTVFLMNISDILRHYWIPLLVGLAVSLIVASRLIKNPPASKRNLTI